MPMIISLVCEHCGACVSILMKDYLSELKFCMDNKIYESYQALSKSGYYICLDCGNTTSNKISEGII